MYVVNLVLPEVDCCHQLRLHCWHSSQCLRFDPGAGAPPHSGRKGTRRSTCGCTRRPATVLRHRVRTAEALPRGSPSVAPSLFRACEPPPANVRCCCWACLLWKCASGATHGATPGGGGGVNPSIPGDDAPIARDDDAAATPCDDRRPQAIVTQRTQKMLMLR